MVLREPMATILLIEDEPAIVNVLTSILESAGYDVLAATTAADGLLALQTASADLAVLDLMLPDCDGLLVLGRLLRKVGKVPPPVLVLSSRDTQADRVLALRLGADDFVCKPFDVDDLVARIEAVLRRARPRAEQGGARDTGEIRTGELWLSIRRGMVTFAGVTVRLTPTEFRLLVPLASQPNEVISRAALSQVIGVYYDPGAAHIVDIHVGRLRMKLRSIRDEVPLETVRGQGYVWREHSAEVQEPQ